MVCVLSMEDEVANNANLKAAQLLPAMKADDAMSIASQFVLQKGVKLVPDTIISAKIMEEFIPVREIPKHRHSISLSCV